MMLNFEAIMISTVLQFCGYSSSMLSKCEAERKMVLLAAFIIFHLETGLHCFMQCLLSY